VGDPVPDIVTREVIVTVGVKLAARVSPPLTGMISEEVVGVKKRSAKASCVNARSRGVAVAVCLGMRTISSWVSGLPPAIKTGRLNANIHAPIKTNTTMAPCALTDPGLLFFFCCKSSTIARSLTICLGLPPLMIHPRRLCHIQGAIVHINLMIIEFLSYGNTWIFVPEMGQGRWVVNFFPSLWQINWTTFLPEAAANGRLPPGSTHCPAM
jgi:hypothetical protein